MVQHAHALSQDNEDVKLIGVYSMEERAAQAVRRALLHPGFKDSPKGFHIDSYEVDEDHWTEGYFTAS